MVKGGCVSYDPTTGKTSYSGSDAPGAWKNHIVGGTLGDSTEDINIKITELYPNYIRVVDQLNRRWNVIKKTQGVILFTIITLEKALKDRILRGLILWYSNNEFQGTTNKSFTENVGWRFMHNTNGYVYGTMNFVKIIAVIGASFVANLFYSAFTILTRDNRIHPHIKSSESDSSGDFGHVPSEGDGLLDCFWSRNRIEPEFAPVVAPVAQIAPIARIAPIVAPTAAPVEAPIAHTQQVIPEQRRIPTTAPLKIEVLDKSNPKYLRIDNVIDQLVKGMPDFAHLLLNDTVMHSLHTDKHTKDEAKELLKIMTEMNTIIRTKDGSRCDEYWNYDQELNLKQNKLSDRIKTLTKSHVDRFFMRNLSRSFHK